MARRIEPERRSPTHRMLAAVGLLAHRRRRRLRGLRSTRSAGVGGNRASSCGAPIRPWPTCLRHRPIAQPAARCHGPRRTRDPSPTDRPATPRPRAIATPRPIAGDARSSVRQTTRTTPTHREFDLTGQVIDIGFPIRPEIDYHYRDNWLDRRDGTPRTRTTTPAKQPTAARCASTTASTSTGRRARRSWRRSPAASSTRDALDAVGARPLRADRGHREHRADDARATPPCWSISTTCWVEVGQRVSAARCSACWAGRATPRTCDPQLHFELRAPFLIDWSPLGEDRRVDAFNPYPSLVEADPHH